MPKLSQKTIFVLVAAVVIAGAAIVYQSWGCTAIGDVEPEMGSQGYRVWSGPTLKSFTHRGQDICVPTGWLPVGALSESGETATFERSKTGVLIQKEAFGLRVIEPAQSSYRVTVLYPINMPRTQVQAIIAQVDNAFSAVGDLYGDRATTTRTAHTVLVTAGLTDAGAVYPDPSARLNLYIRPPESERGEGLLIHGVMHLYNRYSGDRPYLAVQFPFNGGEFQELEATWAEVALTTHPDAAFERLNYLYRVHSAMVAQRPELATAPPFNDKEAFMAVKPTILVKPGAPFLDVQYGHYVLAPLTMAAIDSLLLESGTGLSVRSILRDIHLGKRTSLMETLKEVLTDKEVRALNAWIIADAQIPVTHIQRVIPYYDQ
jgi:hypothetical protein